MSAFGELERRHDIPNERGELLLRHFVYRREDGNKACPYMSRSRPNYVWQWGKSLCPNADDLLYQLPELLETIRGGGIEVWWTEGEKDCDTLSEKAGVVAVSHHGGAGHATIGQAGWFRGYTGRIVLVADWDVAGAVDVVLRYRLLQLVGIPPANIRFVRAAGRFVEGKDAADHFERGFSIDQFVGCDLYKLCEVAATWDGRRGTSVPDPTGNMGPITIVSKQ